MKVVVKTPEILSQVSDLLSNSHLVPEGLEKENLTLFYQIDESGKVIGVIGVESYGRACLLRSLAVREDKRNLGIARTLFKEASDFARIVKSFDVYLLTETIGDTMHRYGYRDVPREAVPADLLESPFFNGICPCSCQLMHRNLGDGDI